MNVKHTTARTKQRVESLNFYLFIIKYFLPFKGPLKNNNKENMELSQIYKQILYENAHSNFCVSFRILPKMSMQHTFNLINTLEGAYIHKALVLLVYGVQIYYYIINGCV